MFQSPFKISTKENRGLMDTANIIGELEAERDRLSAAIQALGGKRRGRPPGRRRSMSAAARAKIGAAMKKRWAARKKSSGEA